MYSACTVGFVAIDCFTNAVAVSAYLVFLRLCLDCQYQFPYSLTGASHHYTYTARSNDALRPAQHFM